MLLLLSLRMKIIGNKRVRSISVKNIFECRKKIFFRLEFTKFNKKANSNSF